jgi:hypothetical protein
MNIVETAVDLEDRLAKEFKNFQLMSRETGALSLILCVEFILLFGYLEDDKTNNLRSHNRKLDQNLLLIVQHKNSQSNKEEWIFPEKTYDGEPSLRAVRIFHISVILVQMLVY